MGMIGTRKRTTWLLALIACIMALFMVSAGPVHADETVKVSSVTETTQDDSIGGNIVSFFKWLVPRRAATTDTLTGTAYAVLTGDAGEELDFIRSTETHTNEEIGSVVSVSGSTYTGVIYTGFETESYDSDNKTPWNAALTSIKTVKFVDKIKPTSTAYWFSGMTKCTSMDLANLDTSTVTTMENMFSGCSGLTTLDVSKFDTSNVTDMGAMFARCTSLESLDLSNFDTSSVTDLTGMMTNCAALKSLNVKSFDLGKVTTINSIFSGDKALTSETLAQSGVLDWDTSNIQDMTNAFGYCTGLTTLDLSKWNTSSMTKCSSFMDECTGLTNINISGWDFKKCTGANLSSMIGGTTNLKSLDMSNCDMSEGGQYLNWIHNSGDWSNLEEINLTGMKAQGIGWAGSLLKGTKIKTLNLSGLNFENINDMSYFASECTELTTVKMEGTTFGKADESYSGSAPDMFQNCTALQSVDMNGTQIKNVRFQDPFSGCSNLETIDMRNASISSTSQDTETMYGFIANLPKLKSVQTEGWQLSKNLVLNSFAKGSTALESFDFDSATFGGGPDMFTGCTALKSIDFSDCTIGDYLFEVGSGCSSLESIDLSNTTVSGGIAGFVRDCPNLSQINMTNMDTSKMTYCYGMISNCPSLREIDLSSWDTTTLVKNNGLNGAFSGATSLAKITIGLKFAVTNASVLPTPTNIYSDPSVESDGTWGLDTENADKWYTVDEMASAFPNAGEATGVWYAQKKGLATGKWGTCPFKVSSDGILTIYAGTGESTDKATSTSWWYPQKKSITAIRLNGTIVFPENVTGLFSRMKNLTDVDMAGADTTGTKDMMGMFAYNSNLSNMDISAFDMSKVTDITAMFSGDAALTSDALKTSGVFDWNTGNITTMNSAFNGCTGLTTLDLHKWNTSNMQYCYSLMYGCKNLTDINISGWNFKKCAGSQMGSMMEDTTNLKSLDMSNCDMSTGGQYLNAMHSADWTNLESVNLSGLKAEGIQGAYNFLKGAKITSLDLSGLNFANCSGMNNFASDCSLLKTVNLTNTTFTGVLYGIFSNCPALSQVITTNMDTAGVTWYGTMFQNCPSLHELDLSSWNTAKATGFNKFADGSGLNKIIIGNNVISGSGFFPTPATTASGKASNGLWGRDSELVDAGVEKVYTASELDSYGSTAGALTGTWYAQAEPTYYTVRFDANKGSGTMEDEQIAVGQTTALSKNSLYRDGYALQGWSTSADADTAEYADTASVKDLAAEGQTATLYAVWDVHPVTDDVRETFTSAISGDTAGEWTIDERRNGKIDLTYDTTNGSWADTDGNSHPNGTFIVRIPTAITYENMNAGSVSTDNIYDVTVAGALTSGKQIEVSAESGKSLVGENLLGNITELTSMSDDQTQNTVGVYGDTNKRLFTAGQASVLTDDGMVVKGTTVTDDIAMSGIVYSAGSYRGTVQYSAALR